MHWSESASHSAIGQFLAARKVEARGAATVPGAGAESRAKPLTSPARPGAQIETTSIPIFVAEFIEQVGMADGFCGYARAAAVPGMGSAVPPPPTIRCENFPCPWVVDAADAPLFRLHPESGTATMRMKSKYLGQSKMVRLRTAFLHGSFEVRKQP